MVLIVEIERIWAMPNRWTFKIRPIKAILDKYIINSNNWFDPFAGFNSFVGITNDLNPNCPTNFHLDAEDFCNILIKEYDGGIFDPPYSAIQLKRLYEELHKPLKQNDTNANFYYRVKRAMVNKIKINGLVICFGWNSNGFGRGLGFELLKVYLIAHGSCRNDTIITIEKRIK